MSIFSTKRKKEDIERLKKENKKLRLVVTYILKQYNLDVSQSVQWVEFLDKLNFDKDLIKQYKAELNKIDQLGEVDL